jgi:hypothetical protein
VNFVASRYDAHLDCAVTGGDGAHLVWYDSLEEEEDITAFIGSELATYYAPYWLLTRFDLGDYSLSAELGLANNVSEKNFLVTSLGHIVRLFN